MTLEEQIKWCHRNNMIIRFFNPNSLFYRLEGERHWHRAYDLADAVKYAQQRLDHKASPKQKRMTITRLRVILKEEFGLGARKVEGFRYGITMNGHKLFDLDISQLSDEQQARERIQHELEYVTEVATRRWQ